MQVGWLRVERQEGDVGVQLTWTDESSYCILTSTRLTDFSLETCYYLASDSKLLLYDGIWHTHSNHTAIIYTWYIKLYLLDISYQI